MLENRPKLSDVLVLFDAWMDQKNFTPDNSVFVTCGDWDLNRMLPSEAGRLGLKYSKCLKRWINIKQLFQHLNPQNCSGGKRKRRPDMKEMLTILGLELDGRHHNGIDDCQNIAKILVHLLRTLPTVEDRKATLIPFFKMLSI